MGTQGIPRIGDGRVKLMLGGGIYKNNTQIKESKSVHKTEIRRTALVKVYCYKESKTFLVSITE